MPVLEQQKLDSEVAKLDGWEVHDGDDDAAWPAQEIARLRASGG